MTAPFQNQAFVGWTRFRRGDFQCTVVTDGPTNIGSPANGFPNADPREIIELLASAFLPTNSMTVLIDYNYWTDLSHIPEASTHHRKNHFSGACYNLLPYGDSLIFIEDNPEVVVDDLIEAAVGSGYRLNDDFNGARQMGVGRFQLTQRNGVRCSAASAYLHPARERANLQVFTDTLVLGLRLDGRRATGVSIYRHGQTETLFSERDILAAGAYGSSQILMLSGIGPAEELDSFRIPVVVDLPVGTNLQDHPLLPMSYLTDERSLFGAGSPEDVALYQKGLGPLTLNIAEGGVFLSTRGDKNVPDCQFEMAPAMYFDEGLSAPFDHAFCMTTTLLKPTSRGKVTLRSARPDAKPRVYHNYLAAAEDRATMISSVRLAMDIFAQPVLSKVKRAPFSVPASDSEADIVAFIEQQIGTNCHPTAHAPSAAWSTLIFGFSAWKVCGSSTRL